VKKIKIILLLTALLTGGTSVYAQQDWQVGVGYALTNFNGVDCSQALVKQPLNGFYAGIRHEFYFSALAGLTFEPGALFYYQSGRNQSADSPKYIKMHFLSFPLDVKYSFGLGGGSTASFCTGPVVNVGLLGNLYEKGKFVTSRDLTDPMHQLTRVNLQWGFGIAFTIAEAVQFRASYSLGMSRLIPEQEIHNNVFSVGAGLLF